VGGLLKNAIVNFESGAFDHSATLPLVDWYLARFGVRGKLIRRSLEASQMSTAKLSLSGLEKEERERADHPTAVAAFT